MKPPIQVPVFLLQTVAGEPPARPAPLEGTARDLQDMEAVEADLRTLREHIDHQTALLADARQAMLRLKMEYEAARQAHLEHVDAIEHRLDQLRSSRQDTYNRMTALLRAEEKSRKE